MNVYIRQTYMFIYIWFHFSLPCRVKTNVLPLVSVTKSCGKWPPFCPTGKSIANQGNMGTYHGIGTIHTDIHNKQMLFW